jgi:hypothetical protein
MVLFNLLGLAAGAFTILMIGFMLVTFRKARTVTHRGSAVSIFISLAVLAAYWIVIGTNLHILVILLILIAGLALGTWRGNRTEIWTEGGVTKARNSMWFLAVFGVCYAFNQLLIILGQAASLSMGIAAICLGTGVAIGAEGNLYRRIGGDRAPRLREGRRAARPGKESPPKRSGTSAASGTRHCLQCGAELATDADFCRKCGATVRRLKE